MTTDNGKIHIFTVTRNNLQRACEEFNKDSGDGLYRSSVERVEPESVGGNTYMLFVRIIGFYPFMLNEAKRYTLEADQ